MSQTANSTNDDAKQMREGEKAQNGNFVACQKGDDDDNEQGTAYSTQEPERNERNAHGKPVPRRGLDVQPSALGLCPWSQGADVHRREHLPV